MIKWQHINKKVIVILQIFGSPFFLCAQKISFNHLLTKGGLSQGSITSIYQDRTGFMWMGTVWNGLIWYHQDVVLGITDLDIFPDKFSNNYYKDGQKIFTTNKPQNCSSGQPWS